MYHGSDVEVKEPKIITSEKGRDFGQAFYLTPIKEQAEKMAKRKQRINGTNSAFVSVFEWNEDYESPSGYWVEDDPETERIVSISVFIKEVLDEENFDYCKW